MLTKDLYVLDEIFIRAPMVNSNFQRKVSEIQAFSLTLFTYRFNMYLYTLMNKQS